MKGLGAEISHLLAIKSAFVAADEDRRGVVRKSDLLKKIEEKGYIFPVNFLKCVL
jgi:hypothetical protein